MYRPQPTKAQLQKKFEPAARVGIFLGYHILAGGKWKRNGGLSVVDLEHTFAKGAGLLDPFAHNPQYHVQRVSECVIGSEGIEFPLKPYFDAKTSGQMYKLQPHGFRHIHDLPAIEPDKEDTDTDVIGDATNGAVEGGIVPPDGVLPPAQATAQ